MAIINKDTIISAFNDKMTLLQWLKKVEKALVEGILKDAKVVKVDEGHIKFAFTFEDGTTQETNEVVLSEVDIFTLSALIEGSESVVVDINESNTALEIHLDADILQRIDRALVLPMSTPAEDKIVSIDTSNAETLLGLGEGLELENNKIKVGGNINLNGNFTADSIIEKTADISFRQTTSTFFINKVTYAGFNKIGNLLSICIAGEVEQLQTATSYQNIGIFDVSKAIGNKLIPSSITGDNKLDMKKINVYTSLTESKEISCICTKAVGTTNDTLYISLLNYNIDVGTKFYYRYEANFLLSDSLVTEVGDLD